MRREQKHHLLDAAAGNTKRIARERKETMKLSRVKRVVLDHGNLAVCQAETGIDVCSWIGCDYAMYPVHGMRMTAMLAAKIWELDAKKISMLHISEDANSNVPVLIDAKTLEGISVMAEAEGEPSLQEVCRINKYVLLRDARDGSGIMFSEDLLGPIDQKKNPQYFREEGRIVSVYVDGKLEAAIHTFKWGKMESIAEAMETIREIVSG